MAAAKRIPGSFRDPSGHLFLRDGTIYRQINQSYQQHYDRLMASQLYDSLVASGWMLPHEEASMTFAESDDAYKIIHPEHVPFISYPYEWSFSQLKDAALLTLDIQSKAIGYGMSLKDASAYNVQFHGGRPLLIDTLSFEALEEGRPWIAYRQFCQHFLAPLALMAYKDVRLNQMLRTHIDGIPLDLASRLLPTRTRLNPGIFVHVHMHAKAQTRFAGSTGRPQRRMPPGALVGLIGGLRSTVRRLRWRAPATEWGDYYDTTSYSREAMAGKEGTVSEYMERVQPGVVWDMGANTGAFSRLAAKAGAFTIAFDIDPVAVERNYLSGKTDGIAGVLPLLMDLTNPSPGIGWENTERMSIVERGPADLVMALALIHHLAISNNVPLERIARFFASICKELIIEFVPKTDSQVQRLLATRDDIFPQYHESGFEQAFTEFFEIRDSASIPDSKRSLYHLRSHQT